MSKDSIRWPAEYDPSPVHVINSLEMSASPADVWDQLIAARLGPGILTCRMFASRTVPRAVSGRGFHLEYFRRGYRVYSQEFVPNEWLAWDARGARLPLG